MGESRVLWPVLANAGAGACEGSEGLEEHLGRGRAVVCGVTPHQGCLPLETPRACTRYVCGHNPAQPVPGAAEGGRALGGTCWWPLHPFRVPAGCRSLRVPHSLPSRCFPTPRLSGSACGGLGRGGDGDRGPPALPCPPADTDPARLGQRGSAGPAGPAASRCLWSCAADSLLLIESWEGTLWR